MVDKITKKERKKPTHCNQNPQLPSCSELGWIDKMRGRKTWWLLIKSWVSGVLGTCVRIFVLPLKSRPVSDELLNLWTSNGEDNCIWTLNELIHVKYLAWSMAQEHPPCNHGDVLVCQTMPTKGITSFISPRAASLSLALTAQKVTVKVKAL